MTAFFQSDAGSYPLEDCDCAVRAFSIAGYLPYWEAHNAFANEGRKSKRGVMIADYARPVAKRLGLQIRKVRTPRTLRGFLARYPEGNFILHVREHAFAVLNGIVHDVSPESDRRRILDAWQILNPRGTLKIFKNSLAT